MEGDDTALVATPIGAVRITGTGERLTGITIGPATGRQHEGRAPVVTEAVRQLRAYFTGELDRFNLPLAPASTARGEALRAALVAIPRGKTMTYGALAAHYGSSARAIGGVCRTNPFPIVVPCHRVVSSGATEFYSAGDGPATKAWLLAHERAWRG